MFRSYKTYGLVLKRSNFGESDKLLTVFTHNLGKISLIAKGIRKIHSRKASHLELFNIVTIYAAIGKKYDYITEAETFRSFKKLKKNLTRIIFAYQVLEIVNLLCPEKEQHPEAYRLVVNVMEKLDVSDEEPGLILESFTAAILQNLGFLPKETNLSATEIKNFLRETVERNLKSEELLTHLSGKV